MSNWILKDSKDDNVFVFPNQTIIAANKFLIVVRKEEDFNTVFLG